MLCPDCGEEVRIIQTLARYSTVAFSTTKEGEKDESKDPDVVTYWDDEGGMDEYVIEEEVACGCVFCPFSLEDDNTVLYHETEEEA